MRNAAFRIFYAATFFLGWNTIPRLDSQWAQLAMCFVLALCLDRWLANA